MTFNGHLRMDYDESAEGISIESLYQSFKERIMNETWIYQHGKYRVGTSTHHLGNCSWCKREIAVTSPRDFGWPGLPSETTETAFGDNSGVSDR